jgi:hypothetical protein
MTINLCSLTADNYNTINVKKNLAHLFIFLTRFRGRAGDGEGEVGRDCPVPERVAQVSQEVVPLATKQSREGTG